MNGPTPGLFVTGTDTGVGKTRVSASILRALAFEGRKVGALKPIATGASLVGKTWISEDAEDLIEALGEDIPRERVTPFLFEEPLAPSIAARRAGRALAFSEVSEGVRQAVDWWSTRADVLVVEGVGGLLCPLTEGTTVADLAVALDFPIVIVARRGLGTLNHTLLTVEAARTRSLRIAGIVLNSPEPERGDVAEATASDELSRRLPGVAILAELSFLGGIGLSHTLDHVDWSERALPPRLQAPR